MIEIEKAATPEEQRIKLTNILNHAMSDPAFQDKVVADPHQQNRRIVSDALFEKGVYNERRSETNFYEKYASDDDFKAGLDEALMRMMGQMLKSNSRLGTM